MFILHQLLRKFKANFAHSRKGQERGAWFIYTLLAVIIPFTSSKTSNLLRCLHTVFGLTHITGRRFYTFMASSKLPWDPLWETLRKAIPNHLTEGRILLALDDCINPKVGKKIFACHRFFDHAAKQNQSRYPWAQNIVAVGLLASIKGRWACLPLDFRFYHPQKAFQKGEVRLGKKKIDFQTKLDQAAEMLRAIYHAYKLPLLVVADSWFGNNGLWKPLHGMLGENVHLLSRLRSDINLFDLPVALPRKRRGRPAKYGVHLANASNTASQYRDLARSYEVNLYGRTRQITAFDRVVMLKTLKRAVRVVWVFRKTRWIALFTTDLSLSVEQIVEYYGARWKIEAGFKELKQEIGSAQTQCRNPQAVVNHLNFCMMATSVIWIYAMQLDKTPERRHAVKGRSHYAFSDVRRYIAESAMSEDFCTICSYERKPIINSVVAALLRMAA
jgi:SRSO17 transposase